MEICIDKQAYYVSTNEKIFHEISHYQLNIYGIKHESPFIIIPINQSFANIRKHSEYQMEILKDLEIFRENIISLKRLHFSTTTKNNKCLMNKLNPLQRFFRLIVEFQVVTKIGQLFTLYSVESDRIIVRVSTKFKKFKTQK